MTRELVFNLISRNRDNLVKIGMAVHVDFEGMFASYVFFDKLNPKKALFKVTEDILEVYKDKIDIWIKIQEELVYWW